MADCFVNVTLDEEMLKKLEETGLADQVKEIAGKKVVQVPMTTKDQKKLKKGFTELEFDDANTCILPEGAESQLFEIILETKSIDVMKFAITKLYNPLAGKSLRAKTF